MSMSVMCQIWKVRWHFKVLIVYDFWLEQRDWVSVMSRLLLGGSKHQLTHANVDTELNGVQYMGKWTLDWLKKIDKEKQTLWSK